MKNRVSKFERVMLDSGAAKSPSGLRAFIHYCIHTDMVPKLKPSSRKFRGMGKGTINSPERCSIRIPIDPPLTLRFEVDIVDHDVPLIIGLYHHLHKK